VSQAAHPAAYIYSTRAQIRLICSIGMQVTLLCNHPFPEAPIGHSWVLAEKNEDGC
jgi:hypothetical protein